MEDLLPAGVVSQLQAQFGERFNLLSPEERVVLSTAAVEATVSHPRAMTLCDIHPVDMTKLLQGLVQGGFLDKVGQGRGTKYHLPGARLADPDNAFMAPLLLARESAQAGPSDLGSEPSDLKSEPSDLSASSSEGLPTSSRGRLVDGLDMPLVDDLDNLDVDLVTELTLAAAPVAGKRVPKAETEAALSSLCSKRYITLRVLAKLLDRSEDYLRMDYLNPMVRKGLLRHAFPQAPNDPRQAYAAAE